MYPALNMLHSIAIQSCHAVCFKLHLDWYADDGCPSNDTDTSEDTPPTPRATPADAQVYLEEQEDFQMVPLDDEHWTTEEVPDRTLCIHKHALLHGLCLYLCPYANYLLPSYTNSMDLSDISDFKDIMMTSSHEDIPALEDVPY